VIDRLIRRIAERLDEDRIPYMIIGGQAVLLYGRPRLTRDIDITLGIDTDHFSQVADACAKLKLRLLPKEPPDFVRETSVLPAEDAKSRIRVDFIFSFSEYERRAIKRAKSITMDGYPARFASCEDVIIHKMVAGRAIDMEDVKSILARNKDAIDLGYIRQWLSQFTEQPEYSGLLDRLNELLSQ
jgi:predicted nucleotidyltransferase